MRLVIEQVFFEPAHQDALFCRVGFVQHLLVERDLGVILVMRVILGIDRFRQEFLDIEQRVDQAMAGGLEHDIEIAAAHRFEPRPGRLDTLGYVQPDLAPLVDQPGRDVFVGLVDIAVEQLEGEPLGPRLLQQAPRLGP